MPHRAAADERLGHVLHLDGGLHARVHAGFFQRLLQRHAVDDRRQHAHVIGRAAVHAAIGRGDAAPDVAAADDDRDLHAHGVDFRHFARDLVGHLRVDDLLLALRALRRSI